MCYHQILVCLAVPLAAVLAIRQPVSVDTSKALYTVDERYIGVALGAGLLRFTPKWRTLDFKSRKVHTLLKGLSPGILRFGGTPADMMLFSEDSSIYKDAGVQSLVFLNESDVDNLSYLARCAGFRLLIDLNLQLRYGQMWDPSNAIKLLNYVQKKGYGDALDLELGNEPSLFNPPHIILNGTQIGHDLLTLKNVVQTYPDMKNASIVGPAVIDKAIESMPLFMDYYFDGRASTWHDYVDWHHFQDLEKLIVAAQETIIASPNPKLKLWIGETSDAYDVADVPDRFICGFLWMDKMGLSAKLGVSIVLRQTFYNSNHPLIDDDLNPNPDYWLTYIHKQLVGTTVLDVTVAADVHLNGFRVYAHCTNPRARYPAGSITMFILNVNSSETVTMTLNSPLGDGQGDLYLLTAPNNDLLSKFTELNGRIMKMPNDTTLPNLYPKSIDISSGVEVPPYSMGFLVLKEAHQALCQ